MTKLEAIEILDNGEWWGELDEWYMDTNPEFKLLPDAVDMAIAALAEQIKENPWYQPCKPCDTVYFILCKTDGNHEIKKGWVQSVEYSCSRKPLLTIRYNDSSLESTKHYLGLKAFMTRREAEEALENLNF